MKRASWILTVLLGMTGANEARAQFFFSNTVAGGPSVRSRSFVRIGPYRFPLLLLSLSLLGRSLLVAKCL